MSEISPIPPPPEDLLHGPSGRFVPAPGLEAWARSTFIEEDGELYNDRYDLLRDFATIGFLWTTERYLKKGKRVVGTAELGEPSGGQAWSKARRRQQVLEWFGPILGDVPDFIVTLDARWFEERRREEQWATICAVVEHELHHCGQDTNSRGEPQWAQGGGPKWGILPHDIEEFFGVARRYGAEAGPDVAGFLAAAAVGPEVSRAMAAVACGCCRTA